MPSVSFVITIYNKSGFIPAVTKAIFAQQGIDDGEYIFVDDGSTDDSLDVLKSCTAGHAGVKIITQENAGPALATNRGIAEVTAPYIKFVDGDDILHPRATTELMAAIKRHHVGMAYSLGREVSIDAREMTAPDIPLPSTDDAADELMPEPLESVVKKALFNLTCVLAETAMVRSAGGCDPRVFIQDYSFALRMAAIAPFVRVNKELNWAPLEAENRASALSGGAQVLHDLNLALAHFIAEHPETPDTIKTKMLRRTTGRAWKWAKREEGQSFLSPHFWRYVAALAAPGMGEAAARIHRTCEAFTIRPGVRRVD